MRWDDEGSLNTAQTRSVERDQVIVTASDHCIVAANALGLLPSASYLLDLIADKPSIQHISASNFAHVFGYTLSSLCSVMDKWYSSVLCVDVTGSSGHGTDETCEGQ